MLTSWLRRRADRPRSKSRRARTDRRRKSRLEVLEGRCLLSTTVYTGTYIDIVASAPVPVGTGAEQLLLVELTAVGKQGALPAGFDGEIRGQLHQQTAPGALTPTLDEPFTDGSVFVTQIDSHFLLLNEDLIWITPPSETAGPPGSSSEPPDASGPQAGLAETSFGTKLFGEFAVTGGGAPESTFVQLVVPAGSTVELDAMAGFGGDSPPPPESVVASFPVLAAEVVGRHVFYNDSKWDESPGNPGGDPAANQYDDNAIAPDPATASSPELGKTALLPGETATFQNYTSYSKGLNGIMVDIAGLAGTPTADDFELKMGNDDNPDAWPNAPDPAVTVRAGEGVGGSDRVTLIWPNYDTVSPDPTTQAVAKQWLQVRVKATPNTGLVARDVFYWGNALGDSGLGNFGERALVNAVDSGAVRDNPHNPYVIPAPLDDFADYNRDQWVNAVDFGFVRDNATNPTTALKLIAAPSAGPLPGPGDASVAAWSDQATRHDAAIDELQVEAPERFGAAWPGAGVPELSWLDGSDAAGAKGRSSNVVNPATAAVEKLLATL